MKRIDNSNIVTAAAFVAAVLSLQTAYAASRIEPTTRAAAQSGVQAAHEVERLVMVGDEAGAMQYATAWMKNSPDGAALIDFTKARILERRGDYKGAIRQYRALLVKVPNFRLAKKGLARSLLLAGDDEAAKFQLESLISASGAAQDADELTRMLASVKSRSPLKYGFYASLLPSSNINTATDNKIIYLNGIPFRINENRKSGIGLIAGGWVTYRQTFMPSKAFIASANLDHRFYPHANTHITNINGAAGVSHEAGTMNATAQLIAGGEFGDFKETMKYVGVRLDGRVSLPANWSIKPFLEVKHQQFDNAQRKNGWLYTGRVTFDKSVSASRFYRAFIGAEFNRAEANRFSYNEALVGVGGYNEFGAGVSIYAEISAAKRKYKAIGLGLTSERLDTRLQARGVFTKRDLNIFGLAPQLGYTFTRNISNSVFDDYTKHDFDVRLTKAF